MKRLFIGGPWDGRVEDIARISREIDPRYGVVLVPTDDPTRPALYYPRELRWATTAGGVSITVMTDKISRDLGRPVLAALIKLAGIDVTWQHDPNDSG